MSMRVAVGKILPEGSATRRTVEGRRKRFQKALAERLRSSGWTESKPNLYVLDSAMSLDEATYEVRYYGDDDETRGNICLTVMRLPQKVRDFACERCVFLSVGRSCVGMCVPQMLCEIRPEDVKGQWIILLDERARAKDALSIVAYEITHAWQGHDRCSPGGCPEGCETQTANLVTKWGFTGIGADAEYCDGRRREVCSLETPANLVEAW